MHKTLTVFLGFILALLVVAFYTANLFVSDGTIVVCLAIFYFVFFHSVRKPIYIVKKIPTFITIEIFFLVFYFILFYYPYQQYLLGFNNLKENSFLHQTFENRVNESILLSTIGLVAFYIGMRGKWKKTGVDIFTPRKNKIDLSNDKILSLFILVLLLFFLAIFSVTGLTKILAGSYIGANSGLVAQDSTNDGIYFLVNHFASLAVAVSIVAYYKSRRINLIIVLSIVVSVSWSFLLLIIGDRNSFFIISTMGIAGYCALFRPIGRIQIVVLVFLALLTYEVIEISRQNTDRSFSAIFNSISSPAAEKTSTDSSFSITTITSRAALDVVPEEMDYFWGKFKLIGIAGVIPYSRKLFVDAEDKFTSSADVLSYATLGSVRSWSVGSNIISDIYLDFGVPGVIILMFAIGKFAVFVTQKTQLNNKSTMWLTIYILCVGLYSELPRYSFDFPVRNIAWTFMLFFLMRFVIKKKVLF